jgi:hypothetical protein
MRSGAARCTLTRRAVSSLRSCSASLWPAGGLVDPFILRSCSGRTFSTPHSARRFWTVGALSPRSQLDTAFLEFPVFSPTCSWLRPVRVRAATMARPISWAYSGSMRAGMSTHSCTMGHSGTRIQGLWFMLTGSRPAWPTGFLTQVPPVRDAPVLAAALRATLGPADSTDGPLLTLTPLTVAGRCVVSTETLSAAGGQQEALLIPLDDNRFGICVDPTPRGGWSKIRPALRPEVERHRHRFRVAHELAHTLFYDRSGTRPRRLRPGSSEEESFCDEFARALLLPPYAVRQRPPTGHSVAMLHREYDVSLEVAARGMAAAQEGLAVAVWYQRPGGGWHLQWANVPEQHTVGRRCRAHLECGRGQAVAVWRMCAPECMPVR